METSNNSIDRQNTSDKRAINERTLRSLLTMHAYTLLRHPSLHHHIFKDSAKMEEIEKILLENSIKDKEKENPHIAREKFIETFCKSCTISDLQDDKENENIKETVKTIIQELNAQEVNK